jgi:hypothetical protein
MPSDPAYTALIRALVRRLNYFALTELGANSTIPQTSGLETARKLWKKLTLKLHPDKGGCEDTFKEMNEAWETFQDAKKAYDEAHGANPSPGNPPQAGPHGGPPTSTPRDYR